MKAVLIGGPRHLDQLNVPDAEQPHMMVMPRVISYRPPRETPGAVYRRTYPDHAGYAIYVCEDS